MNLHIKYLGLLIVADTSLIMGGASKGIVSILLVIVGASIVGILASKARSFEQDIIKE